MPYRDEGEALEQREASLAEELDQIDHELDHLRRLEGRREDLLRALSDVRAVKRQRRLPLSNLAPASPCEANWAAMNGEGRIRQCGRCGKRVYDVASLPRPEALALVMEQGRFADVDEARRTLRVRADGTLIAGDCPLGAHRKRRSRAVVGGGLAALGLATLLSHPAHHGACPHHASASMGPNAIDGAGPVWVELDDEVDIEVGAEWHRHEPYVPYAIDRDEPPSPSAQTDKPDNGDALAEGRRPPPAPPRLEDE